MTIRWATTVAYWIPMATRWNSVTANHWDQAPLNRYDAFSVQQLLHPMPGSPIDALETLKHLLLAAPGRNLSAWRNHQGWQVRHSPQHTLTVDAGDTRSLLQLPEKVQHFVQAAPDNVATGLINYHSLSSDGASLTNTPAAVVHFYSKTPTTLPATQQIEPFDILESLIPDWTHQQYLNAIDAIRDYLLAGDCYQVNLTQQLQGRCQGDSRLAWLKLLHVHPAPHACYLDWGNGQVFGASPESFISIRGSSIITEPIKGSRPRGKTIHEDQQLADDLTNSAKDRAENLMIVDLLRNDLGKVCIPGSISANPLFELRQFSNVQHLVSRVSGTLNNNVLPLQALLTCFPGGSITGAPKHRAMEIIEELETSPRDFYCGSFFVQEGPDTLDANILIRSFQRQGDIIRCHGGGGIVIDSDPEQEYRESLFKIQGLIEAIDGR